MSTFTAGPWTYRKPLNQTSFYKFEVNAVNNGIYKPYICDVRSLDAQGKCNSEENARLIAAAPEMLAALRACQDDYRDQLRAAISNDESDEIDAMLQVIDSAIAKATEMKS